MKSLPWLWQLDQRQRHYLSWQLSDAAITTSSGAAAALNGLLANLEANPYGSLKQEEKALWRQEAQQRMDVVFRVYAASGIMIEAPERLALGDLLLQALAGKQLQIKASHRVEGNYVHVGSLIQLAWAMLKQPKPKGFYVVDACVERIDLLELAQTISHTFGQQAPSLAINLDLPVGLIRGRRSGLQPTAKELSTDSSDAGGTDCRYSCWMRQQAKLNRK